MFTVGTELSYIITLIYVTVLMLNDMFVVISHLITLILVSNGFCSVNLNNGNNLYWTNSICDTWYIFLRFHWGERFWRLDGAEVQNIEQLGRIFEFLVAYWIAEIVSISSRYVYSIHWYLLRRFQAILVQKFLLLLSTQDYMLWN